MRYNPLRHLGLKMVSVVLAVLLWLTVAGEHIVERSLRVPLEFRNMPGQLEMVGAPPGNVDVRVRGSSGILSRLEPGEVVAILDLSPARPGRRLFHLRTRDVDTPFGVEVAQITPATVGLSFERSESKFVPIVPAVEGEPAAGYVAGRVTVQPTVVQVLGPESRLKELTEATTEPLSIENAKATVRDVLTVGVIDSALRLKEPLSAVVSVPIAPAPTERRIGGVPVRVRNLSPRASAEAVPPLVVITVRGPRAALDALQVDSIEAFVDVAGLVPGRYNLPVHTASVNDVGVTAIAPGLVEIRIK